MNHAFVTIVVPFPAQRVRQVNLELDRLGNPQLGPYQAMAAALKAPEAFVHFMSIVVVPGRGAGDRAHLVIEVSGDGHEPEVVRRLADRIPAELRWILDQTLSGPRDTDSLADFLEKHRREFCPAIGCHSGLSFSGTPDLSVTRITSESELALHIRDVLDTLTPGSAYSKLERVRRTVFEEPKWKWAFVAEPISGVTGRPQFSPFIDALAFVRDIAWPWVIVASLLFLVCVVGGVDLATSFWTSVLATSAVAALSGAWAYMRLRRDEERDVPFDREPSRAAMEEIVEREDRLGCVQNHLAGVSLMKPGLVRFLALLAALWVIRRGVRRSRPGFVGDIGSIHFARWLRLPGTKQLVFFSNYDGSWESYLEDFIARLRQGLSSVWSNTVDFPKTRNLIEGGAQDGSRFKRWARRQQIPTRLWFSGYPDLTTHRIRTNALIRHGFASASTEEEAATWLAHFGYAGRESLEMREIPTLAFGGLSKLRFAHCLLVTMPSGQEDSAEAARGWLRSLSNRISYGDRMPKDKAIVLGITSRGMAKLGLDDPSLATFPLAFYQGMDHAQRARTLGDQPARWEWVSQGVDAALLVYGDTPQIVRDQVDLEMNNMRRLGCAVRHEIPLAPMQPTEPFGFTDGISQPIMHGTVRGAREKDRLNTVHPGEMVLGYKDNLGVVAPTPRLAGRDIGRNGTFLVIRQLEQNTRGFDDYLQAEAARLVAAKDPRVPTQDPVKLQEWIGAKMLGRWRDGSSLVRNPETSAGRKKRHAADNNFLYGKEDPDGLRCPFGAHIRRANPRESFQPGSDMQIDISNRHRILRVGRNYEPAAGRNPGILFMCINADIERQFEFLQQSWIFGSNFHGLHNEVDPILGCAAREMIVPTPNGPLRLRNLGDFVKVLGGAYFFLPGRAAFEEISKRETAAARRSKNAFLRA